MAGKSSIDKLPPKARKAAERAARDPASTIHGAVRDVAEAGGTVSKSAMGRWLKNAREQLAEYREAQEVAGLWVKQLGEDPDGDVGVLLSEALKLLAGQVVGDLRRRASDAADGEEDVKPVSAMELMLAAKALDHVAASDAKNQQRRIKDRQLAIEQAAKKTAEVGKRVGLTQASIEELQKELRLL